jgi:hypothetical protein
MVNCDHLPSAVFVNMLDGMDGSNIAGVLDELESQGLLVTAHNALNKTWFIKGDGIFQGYVATSDELIELKRENKLDLSGIKSLG